MVSICYFEVNNYLGASTLFTKDGVEDERSTKETCVANSKVIITFACSCLRGPNFP